ncbi:hypothetical protein KEJ48_07365 [Candidatus Bathyarchaeota archaeon]|nr:hypothetical protein [Candidatus Bathyarchaeota archaeon]MBS7617390.1 hypothetical protein [Candidatus Bathyarchaeota archaeon]
MSIMDCRDFKALKSSTVTLTFLSAFLIVIRVAGYRLLDESFEFFCIHVPALASIILYILAKYLQLKLEA